MPSRIWSREDIRNILLALYAARLSPLDHGAGDDAGLDPQERLYRWGCRVAIQSLLLACGLPLQLLDQAVEHPVPLESDRTGASQHWWMEDLENIIAAVYRSAISTPIQDPDRPKIELYRQGFNDVIVAVLQALGSHQDPQRWVDEVRADREWVFPYEPTDLEAEPRMNVFGSADEPGPASGST
jgi:hypothetical protein